MPHTSIGFQRIIQYLRCLAEVKGADQEGAGEAVLEEAEEEDLIFLSLE